MSDARDEQIERLREHARIHAGMIPFDDEQAVWRDDLLWAADEIEHLTADRDSWKSSIMHLTEVEQDNELLRAALAKVRTQYFRAPFTFIEPESDQDSEGPRIVDADASLVAKLFWPFHPVEATEAAEQETYAVGRAMAATVEPASPAETRPNDAPTVRPAVTQVADPDRSNGPSVNEGAIPSGAASYMGMDEQRFREWEELYTPCKAEVGNWKAITISHCQRIHRLGYNRAARIMEALEAFGVLKRDRATGAFSVNQGVKP